MNETLNTFLDQASQRLQLANLPEPRVDVEWLAEHVLGIPRLELGLHRERPLSDDERERLTGFIEQREKRIPLQHLIGWVPFLDFTIRVSADALIPRPETELLAERACAILDRMEGVTRVLDIGTGTGCLAITLAARRSQCEVVAVDISRAALALAQKNVLLNDVAERIELVESDLFDQLDRAKPSDLIVSNPPYIPTDEIATLQTEVREHDPRMALDGGADGLSVYRRFATDCPSYLKPGGRVLLEFGDGQAEALIGVFEPERFVTIGTYDDLNGRPRMLEFQWPG